MESVKLDTLAKHLQISNRDVYDALLSYGDFTQQKVLHYLDEDLVMSESLYLDILDIDGYIQECIKSEGIIKNKAAKCIPFDTLPRVYFLLDGDIVVYVGQSMAIAGRISQHVTNKTFDKVATFKVIKSELDMVEMINIKYYYPIYNKDVITPCDYLRHILKRL